MNTQYKHYRVWALLSMLFLMLPIDLLAQTITHEMVLEKKDGTELTFDIGNSYTEVSYEKSYDSSPSKINIINNYQLTSLKCYEVKRLYVREKNSSGINNITISKSSQIYDISGRKVNTTRDQLSKGIYIIDGRKIVVN